jgi:hypothetical protein
MRRWNGVLLIGVTVLAGTPALGRDACQERTLSLRYSPQARDRWCWAASSEMVLEFLGEQSARACQCRLAQAVLGSTNCCAGPASCVPSADASVRCNEPRWPAFVERPGLYRFYYRTTCDALPNRQDDDGCEGRPIGWRDLADEICHGRPVIAVLRPRGSALGHAVVVKGVSTHPRRRVLVLDPASLCPSNRDCEGELDEGFWISYEEFAAGWDGRVHWVDFYGIRSVVRRKTAAASVH